MRRLYVALLTGVLVVGSVVPLSLTAPAAAATVKVCVNKKSGEVKKLRGRSCAKGWKKVSWTRRGERGLPGRSGPVGQPGERGAAGTMSLYAGDRRVGPVIGGIAEGVFLPVVLIDGGNYTFLPDGRLYPNIGSPSYRTADCTGTAYVTSVLEEAEAQRIALMAGSSVRFVERVSAPQLGAVMGTWKVTGTYEALPPGGEAFFTRDESGTCQPIPVPVTGYQVPLTSVRTPSDLVGPLTIR